MVFLTRYYMSWRLSHFYVFWQLANKTMQCDIIKKAFQTILNFSKLREIQKNCMNLRNFEHFSEFFQFFPIFFRNFRNFFSIFSNCKKNPTESVQSCGYKGFKINCVLRTLNVSAIFAQIFMLFLLVFAEKFYGRRKSYTFF